MGRDGLEPPKTELTVSDLQSGAIATLPTTQIFQRTLKQKSSTFLRWSFLSFLFYKLLSFAPPHISF